MLRQNTTLPFSWHHRRTTLFADAFPIMGCLFCLLRDVNYCKIMHASKCGKKHYLVLTNRFTVFSVGNARTRTACIRHVFRP